MRYLIFLLSLLGALHATGVPLQQYSTVNGLVSNTVYHCYADSRGFLWIATDKGIARFDGKNFVNFTTLDGLSDNTNFNFFEDRDHCIWPFAFNGQNCRIRNTTVEQSPVQSLPATSYINTMCYDNTGALYVGYYDGDVYKVANGKAAIFYRHRSGDSYVHSIVFQNGMLKVYGNPVWRYFKDGRLVDTMHVGSSSNFYYNDQLFVADSEGIKVFRDDTLIYKRNDPDFVHGKLIHLYGDTSGNIFCSTRNGLFIFNRYTNRQYHLLTGQQVHCCVQDRTGDYWIAVFNKGVWRMSKAFADIADLSGTVPVKKVFRSSFGSFFATDNSKVYVPEQTANGMQLKPLPVPFSSNCEPLYYHDNIYIYNAGTSIGIIACFYNTVTGRTDSLLPYSRKIIGMGNNNFLISAFQTLTGLYYDGELFEKRASYHLAGKRINICTASGGGAWVLQDDTLYRCDQQYMLHKRGHRAGWNAVQRIRQFYGKLFFMSDAPGVAVYDEKTLRPMGSYLPFTHNVVYDVAALPDSTLLFYTLRGEYILQQKAGIYSVRPLQFPFGANEYDEVCPVGNQCVFYRQEGLYTINVNQLNRAPAIPPLLIQSLEINGKYYNAAQPVHIKNATACDINISAATLYFRGTRNAIQYRVVSDEAGEWKNIDGNNLHIQLSGFGDHSVQLRALYENHDPASAVQTIAITMSPPYYRSRWFNVLVFLLLAALAVFCVEWYIRRRKKVMISELNYLKMEHKSINSLLNPHFVFNAINNIQSLINTGTREKANDYLATMSTLIRQNIENLQFHFVTLSNEIDLIRNYVDLQNLRFDNNIILEIHDEDKLAETVVIPPLLIHTFVENAIVHGFRDKTIPFHICIDISLYHTAYALIHITDNGVGLQPAGYMPALKNKTSLGIGFNKKRLDRINRFYKLKQSILVTDRRGKGEQGTEVVIVLYRFLGALIADG